MECALTPMHSAPLVLLLLLVLISWNGSQALTDGEVKALQEILTTWSSLRESPFNWKREHLANACVPPIPLGLTCSDDPDPHIIGLSLELHWSDAPRSVFPPAIGNLIFLEQLAISKFIITGGLPPSLANLTALTSFSLSGTGLAGKMPDIFANMTKLENFTLKEETMNGGMPESMISCVLLRSLVWHGAGFSGPFPSTFQYWTKLQVLSVVADSWKAPLLQSLAPLKELQVLELRIPGSTGYFDPEFWSITSLTSIYIKFPHVSGEMTPNVANMTSLKSFTSVDSLSGQMPSSFWTLSNLETIGLTQYSGMQVTVDSVAGMTSLKSLELTGWEISGDFHDFGSLSSLEDLRVSSTSMKGPLPDTIGNLHNLKAIAIRNSGPMGQLPAVLTNMTSLTELTVTISGVSGTIPSPWIKYIETLILSQNHLRGPLPVFEDVSQWYLKSGTLDLSFNALSGTLDAISQLHFGSCDLSFNSFSGTVPPPLLANTAGTLKISNNELVGTLPERTRAPYVLSLSSNALSGNLPILETILKGGELDMSDNAFTGALPIDYLTRWQTIVLNDNQLTAIPTIPNSTVTKALNLRNNKLTGRLQNSLPTQLTSLFLSNNGLHGPLPRCSPSLNFPDAQTNPMSLDLSHNAFTGTLDPVISCSYIDILDVSSNDLIGTVPDAISKILVVKLSDNELSGTLAPIPDDGKINWLDVSSNNLSAFAQPWSRSIMYQDLSNNPVSEFYPAMPNMGATFPLSYLDISNSPTRLPLSGFASAYPRLETIRAKNASMSGVIDLSRLSFLQMADLSSNHFDRLISWHMLSASFEAGLTALMIADNPLLPRFPTWNNTVLLRSNQTQPSVHANVVCYTIVFKANPQATFKYDEALFNYSQCECSYNYYGHPPNKCAKCPRFATCISNVVTVPGDFYVYSYINTSSEGNQELLAIETCIQSVADTRSGCIGAKLDSADQLPSITQCAPGSRGRMCSECVCEPTVGPSQECYFPRGAVCVKCGHISSLSTSLAITAAIVFVFFVALCVAMYFVIYYARKRRKEKFEQLPISRRIFYRILLGLSLGHVSIMVSFVQLLSEMTHWSQYALRYWSQLMNARTEAFGIRCVFPFMANPIAETLITLLLPIFAIMIVSAAIGVAVLALRWRKRWKKTRLSKALKIQSDEDSSGSQSEFLLEQDAAPQSKYIEVRYPATALLATLVFTICRFFYFSTALAATENFFITTQALSDIRYTQRRPWLRFEDAATLRYMSWPWLILFVGGLPFVFVYLAWRVRNSLEDQNVIIYTGSLFKKYSMRMFWWEFVVVTRTWVIALLLRSLPSVGALQPTLIMLVLGVVLMLQVSQCPWKRRTENIGDSGASVLLLVANSVSFVTPLPGSNIAVAIVGLLCLLFLVLMVATTVYHAVTEETDYHEKFRAAFPHLAEPSDDKRDPSLLAGTCQASEK